MLKMTRKKNWGFEPLETDIFLSPDTTGGSEGVARFLERQD